MRYYSRRQLLAASFATASLSLPIKSMASAMTPLYIPPLLEIGRGKPLYLTLQPTETSFEGGKKVTVWGFNDHYLGPTIRVRWGDFVRINYRNNLPEAVSLNIQGLLADGASPSGMGRELPPKSVWSPVVSITQNPATCWYHADTIGRSAYQTYRGLCGLWLIEERRSSKGAKNNPFLLPHQYGINDIPLILQDMSLNYAGKQLINLDKNSFYGNKLFVNGCYNSFINVPRGWVRLRLLNGSVSRIYHLRFSDQRQMLKIATGQDFLPKPQTLTELTLAPGERAEVLVNFNQGDKVYLLGGNTESLWEQAKTFFGIGHQPESNRLVEFRPEGVATVFDTVPQAPAPAELPYLAINVKQIRRFVLDTENALINQRRFDSNRIDISASLNSFERWIITADRAVGFYLQGAKFMVEKQRGKVLDLTQQSWQDTVLIDGETEILVRFTHRSTNSYPFLFGVTDLLLADKGCLGMLVVS
ncbi:cell division protein FtsQ [Mergibacter septicus]|uniref:multicopper oxidase domain-containing protein n=1 Tax=Mergibacter septicus TaxID=221402 RepID=UPI00117909A0|nr:multicopper oxidase domain-containing protein [Mergibacter septicus]AWX13057.1 cell division protein FtsQ [Mergibacter septicus]AWX14582.1 cell division protein FtsQ [Mergibacter septicus]